MKPSLDPTKKAGPGADRWIAQKRLIRGGVYHLSLGPRLSIVMRIDISGKIERMWYWDRRLTAKERCQVKRWLVECLSEVLDYDVIEARKNRKKG